MRYWVFAVPLMLGACAATAPGDNGIAIETTSNQQVISGASCLVSNNNGAWTVVTPATVDTGGVNGDLRVLCNKNGYRTSEFVFRPMQTAGSSVGIGLGGGGSRAGVGFGLNVPIGGMRGGTYPPRIAVEMTPQ
jgi:hypothetical protein